jgi:hypothetical protein
MDMKKILESLEKVESKDSTFLAEGSNTLSVAEQMIMQQYSAPKKEKKPSVIKKYFESVEQEKLAQQEEKKKEYAAKAKKISEKLIAESGTYYKPGKSSNMSKHIAQSKKMPDSVRQSAKQSAARMIGEDEVDTVTLDIPLLLRVMEYSKEDAKTDMDLHHAVEKMIELSKQSEKLSMDHYEAIVGEQKALPSPDDMNEVSTALLTRYKKAAGADATKADAEGDFEKGNKRFSGIVKATKKQFANDLKTHKK